MEIHLNSSYEMTKEKRFGALIESREMKGKQFQ